MPIEDMPPLPPSRVATTLLMDYLGPTLQQLSSVAQKHLVEAWQTNPAALVAAGTVIGATGATFLIESKAPFPRLPAIPLDFVGSAFRGVELQLVVHGPVTHPDALMFNVSFRPRAPARIPHDVDPGPAPIDTALTRAGTTPEQIATRVNGPAFETETVGGGPEDNWSLDLGERVRIIGGVILEQASRGIDRPFVDLGDMAFVPGTFADGLHAMVLALVAALPDDLGHVTQVNFAARNAIDGWIPVVVR